MFHLVTMRPCILGNKSRNRVRSIIPSCLQAVNTLTQELYMAIPPEEHYVLRLMLTLHNAIFSAISHSNLTHHQKTPSRVAMKQDARSVYLVRWMPFFQACF